MRITDQEKFGEVAFITVVCSDGESFWTPKPLCPACGENHSNVRIPTRISTVHMLENRDAIVVPNV